MRHFARFVRYRPAVLAACLAACLAVLPLATAPALAQLSTVGSLLLQQGGAGIPGTADGEEHFGHALAAGDFDGDGRDDLAIGAPFESVAPVAEIGAVTVVYFAAGLPIGSVSEVRTLESLTAETASEGDLFGRALAVGDFDADGFDDLAVGAPGDDVVGFVDNGAINVLYGSAAGLSLVDDQIWTQNDIVVNGDEDGDQFGSALAAGDFDGDGFDDLAIGVPYEDYIAVADAGAIYQFVGGASGLDTGSGAPFVVQETIAVGGSEPGDEFGRELAAGDLNGDGVDDLLVASPGEDYDDLAVGVPYEGVGAIPEAGAVNILWSAGLFRDGFESADSDAWSSAVAN